MSETTEPALPSEVIASIDVPPEADLVAIAAAAGNAALEDRWYSGGRLYVRLQAASQEEAQAALDAALAQVGTAPPAPPRIRVIRALAFRERIPESRRSSLSVAAMSAAAQGDGTLLTFLWDQAAASVTDLDNERVQAGVAMMLAAGLITQGERDALLADGTPEEAASP